LSNRFAYVLLCAGLLSGLMAAPQLAAESVVLLDQFGVPGSLTENAGSVQVVIVVSAKRLRRIKPWERALRQRFGDLPFLRVADVPRTSPTTHEQVAAKLARRLPSDLSVLIDLDGRWAETYGLDTSVPNLLLFAGDGRLIAREAGMFSESGLVTFSAHVQTALDAGVAHPVPAEP
jgi:hypothetical protein